MKRNDLFMQLADHFLSEPLPGDWFDLEEADQDEFIQMNTWQPLERFESSEILDFIGNATDSTVRFLEAEGIQVKQ